MVVFPDGRQVQARGTVEGRIARTRQGRRGLRLRPGVRARRRRRTDVRRDGAGGEASALAPGGGLPGAGLGIVGRRLADRRLTLTRIGQADWTGGERTGRRRQGRRAWRMTAQRRERETFVTPPRTRWEFASSLFRGVGGRAPEADDSDSAPESLAGLGGTDHRREPTDGEFELARGGRSARLRCRRRPEPAPGAAGWGDECSTSRTTRGGRSGRIAALDDPARTTDEPDPHAQTGAPRRVGLRAGPFSFRGSEPTGRGTMPP